MKIVICWLIALALMVVTVICANLFRSFPDVQVGSMFSDESSKMGYPSHVEHGRTSNSISLSYNYGNALFGYLLLKIEVDENGKIVHVGKDTF